MLEGAGLILKAELLCVSYDQTFGRWTDRAGVGSKVKEQLKEMFLNAPEKVKAAFGIECDSDVIKFHWNAYVFRAERKD